MGKDSPVLEKLSRDSEAGGQNLVAVNREGPLPPKLRQGQALIVQH